MNSFDADPSGDLLAKNVSIGHETWRSTVRALSVGVLRGASLFYGVGARLHRAVMRRSAAGRGRLACAVVSVGGLTVGGAGKTPFAARLACWSITWVISP